VVARWRRAELEGLLEERETCGQETLSIREIKVKEEQGRPEYRRPH